MSQHTSEPTRTRGRHRVFLGYAPGVGKTFAMLVESRLRIGRGEDVVVGHLGPHTRAATRKVADRFEWIAPQMVAYRGIQFPELDIEAVIARCPEWVIVDELAHTNAPGTHHEKRWQSVEEILDAGIGVLSTLNVQHIESLNDYVYQVSGVRVAETVPDKVINGAELVVVDAEPDELLARVRRGQVVPRDEVGQALSHFFRKPTLVALRERALAFGAAASDDRRQPGDPL